MALASPMLPGEFVSGEVKYTANRGQLERQRVSSEFNGEGLGLKLDEDVGVVGDDTEV